MGGIKFHAAVDSEISGNHIYRCNRGIWLDWMTQGTHVSRNLLHDNGPSEDLFLEVNHGPALIENNLLLSEKSLLVNSQGEAYAHNLIAGRIHVITGEKRETPHLKEHATEVAGLAPNKSGDQRFYNNILLGKADLGQYNRTILPVWMEGNVFLNGAKPGKAEKEPLLLPEVDPELNLVEKSDGWFLEFTYEKAWSASHPNKLITTELLGTVEVPGLSYVKPDGKSYTIDKDYNGRNRNSTNPFAGPFAIGEGGKQIISVWPKE
jgi:hypothetical protein